jgi:hypothetical protein
LRSFPGFAPRGWSSGGERDAIFTAFRNDERERFCHFPNEPLARDKWVFFVRTADAGKLKFSSFDDLVGHDIAVLRGAAISPEFWDFVRQHRNFVETASDEADFRLLEAGRVDYVVASFANGMRLIGSLGLDGKVQALSSRSLKEDDMSFSARSGFRQLLSTRSLTRCINSSRPRRSGRYTASTFLQLLMSLPNELLTTVPREPVLRPQRPKPTAWRTPFSSLVNPQRLPNPFPRAG